MKIEELKALLTKEFKDRENPAALGFLEEIAMHPYEFAVHLENRKQRQSFLPILIPEYKLLMSIAIEYDEKEAANYHQITFENTEKPRRLYGAISLDSNKNFQSSKTRIVTGVKNGKVYVYEVTNCYHFDSHYQVTRTEDTISNGVEIDIVNRTHRLLGLNVHADKTATETLLRMNGGFSTNSVSREAWTQAVLDNANKDSAFARVAQECNLVELCKHSAAGMAMALLQYIQFNDLKHVLHDEYYYKLYDDYISRSAWGHISRATHAEQHFKHGQNAAEVMGINSTHEAYYHDVWKFARYEDLLDLDAILESVHKVMPISCREDIQKINQIIGTIIFWNADAQLGKLIYLGRLGYTLHELHAYLIKVEKKQAIPVNLGFDALYRVTTHYELLTGEKKKFFPKYLRIADDVFTRDINIMENTSSGSSDGQIFERVKNRRAELWMDEKDFEILPPPNDETASATISESVKGTDTLLYKKKRGTRYTTISLSGDTVTKLSENIGSQHMKHLYVWAKKNNLIIGNHKLY